jgi:hypothetical protein
MRSDVPVPTRRSPRLVSALVAPTKIAGRHLAPYLFERDEDEVLGKPPAGFVDVDIPLAAITLRADGLG